MLYNPPKYLCQHYHLLDELRTGIETEEFKSIQTEEMKRDQFRVDLGEERKNEQLEDFQLRELEETKEIR